MSGFVLLYNWRARQIQRLRFRQICTILKGVRTRNEVSIGVELIVHVIE